MIVSFFLSAIHVKVLKLEMDTLKISMLLKTLIFNLIYTQMEDNKVPQSTMNKVVISLYFTIAYAVLLSIYLALPININSNFLLMLFIVCSLLFSVAAIYFAAKSYKEAKISSVILIIINVLGLLIPLAMLLMIFT